MSGPLAIAAVTAVLKDVLNNGLIDQDISSFVGSFSVTALPPDRISTGTQEPNQINLYLYRVTTNQGWCNQGLPSRDSTGGRISNPPLALDLHYLLSTYGSQDFNAEILLGHAMQILHETPQITRKNIRIALGSPTPPIDSTVLPPSPFGSLSAIDLADQVELIKITPQFLSSEDLSKLWTAMQARYRQSMAYQVSVVLIQSTKPARAALPVISRGDKEDRGIEASTDARSPFPFLESIHIGPIEDASIQPLPRSYPSAQLDLPLILQGQNLNGEKVRVNFKHTRFVEPDHPQFLPPKSIPVESADRTATEIKVSIPNDIAEQTKWRAGLYTVSVMVTKDTEEHKSNELPLVMAPQVKTIAPSNSISRVGVDATITITCSPRVIKEQKATLLLADREVTANPRSVTTDTLVFVVKNAPLVKDAPIRLRVDDYDSMPFERKYDINGNPLPLAFADNQKVTIT